MILAFQYHGRSNGSTVIQSSEANVNSNITTSFQCCFEVSTVYTCLGRPLIPACVYIWCGVKRDVLSCANSEDSDQPAH